MPTKVYSAGGFIVIEQVGQNLIPITVFNYSFNADTLVLINEFTGDTFHDALVNIQNQSGTPVGNQAAIDLYLKGLVPSTSGVQFGTYTYINSGTQAIVSGVETLLENNGVAGTNFGLTGVPELYNTTTFQVLPGAAAGLTFGDIVESGLAFTMTTTSPNQRVEIKVLGAIGSPSANTTELVNMSFKNAGLQSFTAFFLGDGQTQDQLDFPSEFRVLTDAPLTISFDYLFLKVIKR